MQYVSTPRRYGPSGPAEVSISGKAVTIEFLDQEAVRKTGEKFMANLADLPLVGDRKPISGRYFVQLTPDKSKITAFRPWTATLVCRFLNFASQTGSLPAPKHFSGERKKKDGSTFPVDEQTFTALLEVVEGPYEGFQIPSTFTYLTRDPKDPENVAGFVRNAEGNVGLAGSGRKNIQKLSSFLEASGLWGDGKEIPYSDNILPALQEIILKQDKYMMVVIRNGWPETFADAYRTPPTKRKPAAKKAKK